MQHRHVMNRAKWAVVGCLFLAASPVLADDAAPAVTAPASEAAPIKLRVGGGLEAAPIGSTSGPLGTVGTDTGAYGVDLIGLYQIHPAIGIGIAPRYVGGLSSGGAMNKSSMYDLRVVAAVGKELVPKVHAMGLVGFGYSSISLADGAPSPAGPTVSLAAIGGYDLTHRIMATATVGYELGYQSVDVSGNNIDLHFNHLMVGLGVLAALM